MCTASKSLLSKLIIIHIYIIYDTRWRLGNGRVYYSATYSYAAETLVIACATSVMDYANSTSLGVPQVHTNNLQRLQNMAARIICRCGPRDHVTPLRKELHWLPNEARPMFKILCHTYKAIHDNRPDFMCDLVSVTTPSDVASDRETLVSRDYAQSRQILLNMDTCVIDI